MGNKKFCLKTKIKIIRKGGKNMSGNFIKGSESEGVVIVDCHPTVESICAICSMQCEEGCSEFLNGADK
ncbi:MAG: hypothetical protein P1P85_01300 [Patescibacteria group bacterium]|nr:hypothetical protein [Patescibacteria group bacterium]